MTALEILRILQRDIHTTVFATVDEKGLPWTCVIDLMLADGDGLYFLTAKGKAFYERLTARPFVALSGIRGKDTLSSVAISLRGAVRGIGQDRLTEIFAKNSYMAKIYPVEESRSALEVFQIYRGEGEYFDLSRRPVFRESFSFGGEETRRTGYRIDGSKCTACGSCIEVCPQGCIVEDFSCPRPCHAMRILSEHCLHCGNCYRDCPSGAVEKI